MKNNPQFKTMRHIETVRNFLNACIKELMSRGENHDQSKLQPPELEIFNKYTPFLRGLTFGSQEYKDGIAKMKPAVQHHYKNNRHHPEAHKNGIADMNLIDLIEMVADWKAAGLRHEDGDIYKSIAINKEKYGFPVPKNATGRQ